METIELRINCGAVVEIPAAAHENFQFIWPCGARGSFSSSSALAIKEHPMTFEEIEARAIELFSKLRPIEEWPYIDEGDRNYWRKKRATNWMNLSQLRRAVWLRRLSAASQSRFTLLKNHHRLGWLSTKTLFERRDALAAKMTPTQIAEAQKLPREWKSSEQ